MTPSKTSSLRHVAACGGVAAGACLLTGSLLLPAFVVPRLVKLPLNLSVATVSEAKEASVLDPEALANGKVKTTVGVPLRTSMKVTAEDPAGPDAVMIQAATLLERTDRTGKSRTVQGFVDRVSVDRRSALMRASPTPTIQSKADGPAVPVPREGYRYKFPFSTRKQTYPYFDSTARITAPLDYVDDHRAVDGVQLYHFQQKIGPLDMTSTQPDRFLTMPAGAWGLPGDGPVRMTLRYKVERDLWVEPVSGSPVAQEEHMHLYFARSADDPAAVTALEMRTRFDDATLKRTSAFAKSNRNKVLWLTWFGPLSCVAAGLPLLGAGMWLGYASARTRREDAS